MALFFENEIGEKHRQRIREAYPDDPQPAVLAPLHPVEAGAAERGPFCRSLWPPIEIE